MPKNPKAKFSEYIGEYQYTLHGRTILVEVRPSYRVLIHDEAEETGEIYFMNRSHIAARIRAQKWEKIVDDSSGQIYPDTLLSLPETPDVGLDPERSSEVILEHGPDLHPLVSIANEVYPPTTNGGTVPETIKNPDERELPGPIWVRWRRRIRRKDATQSNFGSWHKVKSILPCFPIGSFVVKFRCGNTVTLLEFELLNAAEFLQDPMKSYGTLCPTCRMVRHLNSLLVAGLPKRLAIV